MKQGYLVGECKGILMRGERWNNASFTNTRTYIFQSIRLTILRRKSCKGCKQCGGMYDQMSEICNDWEVEGLQDVEHGGLYRLSIVITGYDFETGHPDEWNYKVEKIKEE